MDTQPLNLKIDSGQARADLAQLDRALELAGNAAVKMGQQFTTGLGGVDKSVKGAMGSMEKFASVASLLSKIKVDGSGIKAVTDFTKALNQLARAREIEQGKLNSYRKFIEIGALASKLRMGGSGYEGLKAFTQAVDAASRARAIQPAKLASWVKFIEVAAMSSRLRMSSNFASSLKQFGEAMDAVSRVRAITPARVAAIKSLFDVLSSAKGLPNASKIASDLDQIAAAATRAGAAFKTLPTHLSGFTGKAGGVASSASNLNRSLKEMPQTTAKAASGFKGLFGALDGLGNRFNLTYQAGTLLSAFFASFTVGQFLKGIYDTNISFQKLNKSMLFVTGSFKAAHDAVDQYIGISYRLGTSIEANADAYGRFAISAGAAGLSLKDVNQIYEGTVTALQAVGATSAQSSLAFYGLSQAMSKGKLSSEEFNRQIGEQIPGNAQAGAKALSVLTGKAETAATLFKAMQDGAIMSAPFLKEWAKQLQIMYAPLLPVAANRPDFQLNRLSNAFALFKKEVGDNKFIGALVQEFKSLSDQLVTVGADGVPKLTKKAEELAETLGGGLAKVVHIIGDAVSWLAGNIDKVIAALRGLAALAVVQTFGQWAKAASNFGDKMRGVGAYAEEAKERREQRQATRAMEQQKRAERLAQVQAARAARRAEPVRTAPAAIASLNLGDTGDRLYGRRQRRETTFGRPSLTGDDRYFGGWRAGRARAAFGFQQDLFPDRHSERDFGRRTNQFRESSFDARPRPTIGQRVSSAARNVDFRKVADGLVDGFSALPGKLTPAFNIVRMGFNALPMLLGGVGVALALFGDRITTLGKDAKVSYNDIAMGALSTAGDITGKGLTDLLNGLTALNSTASEGTNGKSLGDWFVSLSAAIITTGKVVFTVATSIGKILGTFLVNSIVPWIEVMQKVGAKDYGGALKQAAGQLAFGQGSEENRERWIAIGKEIGNDLKSAIDFGAVEQQIIANAKKSAADREAARNGDTAATDASKAADAQIEAAMQQRAAADAQVAAARDLQDAAEELKGEITGPDASRSLARIQALIDGTYVSATNASPNVSAALRNTPLASAASTAASGVGTSTTTTASAPTAAEFVNTVSTRATATLEDASAEAARNNDLADKIQRMPKDIGLAITKAARDQGFDPAVLIRMAARESDAKWNPASRNPASTARGLFQITGTDTRGTYKGLKDRYGAFNPDDPYQAAVAAARLVKDDAAIVKAKTGVELTAGESYLTHFLGGAGASALINARKSTPGMAAADVNGLGAAAGANRTVFYADRGKGRAYTVEELYGKLSRVNGGSGGMASAGGIASEDDADKSANRQLATWKSLQTVLGDGGPAAQAQAEFNRNMATLDQAITREEKEALKQGADFQTIFKPIQPMVIASIEKWKKTLDDAIRPLEKETRILEGSNKVLELRARGQGLEADWQEKLNELRAQGYDITSKEITGSRAALEAAQARQSALQAELKVTQALNDARADSIARRGTSRDADIAAQIASRANDWNVSYQDAQARMNSSGELAAVSRGADVRDASRREGAAEGFRQNILEATAMAGMSDAQKQYRDDYKTYLKEITGANSNALKDIEAAATDAEKKMAKGYADLKKALENPPGFQRWANSLAPLSDRLQDIKADFMEGLSQGITDALSGEEVDWKAMMHDLSKKALKAQVDEALKGTLNLFGIGKKDVAATPEAQALISAADTQSTAATGLDLATDKFSLVVDKFGAMLDAANAQSTASAASAAATPTVQSIGSMADIVPATSEYVSDGGQWSPMDEALAQGGSMLGAFQSAADMAAGVMANPTVNGTDLQMSGATVNKTSGLGLAAQALFDTDGAVRLETPMAGKSAAAGNTAVTSGTGLITGPRGSGSTTVGNAQMQIGSANMSPSTLTMSATDVTLNATNVTGMGGGAGGAAGSALGGAAGGGLSGFTNSTSTIFDSALSPISVDQTGGAGFLPAGSGMPDLSGMTAFGSGDISGMSSFGGDLSNLNTSTLSVGDSMLSPISVDSTGGAGFLPAGAGIPDLSGMTAFGESGGFLAGLASRGMGLLKSLGPLAIAQLTKKKQKKEEIRKDINGVIGESRPVEVTGTHIAAHGNLVGDLLKQGLSWFTGGFGQGGGMDIGKTFGNMGASMSKNLGNIGSGFGKIFGAFEEGGYVNQPVGKAVMDMSAWRDAPHYSEGTPNTSNGGMPVVVHPNEAIIPLSRGRSIPVDLPDGAMGGGNSNYNVTSNITVVAPNPDSFRKSQGSIQRQQNRDLRRSAARNLTP